MTTITYRDALRSAIDEEMARDERVFLMGEEVAEYHGAYKVSRGLLDKYGDMRVLDTPITESGFTGVGIGAAMAGLRPIIEWMTFNFAFQAMDQVINNAAKMRYMSGGQFEMPIVFRGPNGPAEWLASQHSHACATFYAHVPGLKVIAPSTPYDAKGMLKTAIRDNNPVVMMEGEMAYGMKGEVPDEEYLIDFGQADVKRCGNDVTLVTFGMVLGTVQEAAEELGRIGIDAELIDLRSLRPLDEDTIYESVTKTNCCIVVDQSWPMASVGSYIAWLISKFCFDELDAQVELVCGEDIPMPYNHQLELAAQPSVEKIIDAVKTVMYLK